MEIEVAKKAKKKIVRREYTKAVFDTIYHEHVSHHALLPMETFLNRHDMTLFFAHSMRTTHPSTCAASPPRHSDGRPVRPCRQ
jgi:hypothetical protein